MAVSIDPRVSYFGDRIVVTGSYAAGDGTGSAGAATRLDLGDLMVEVDVVMLTPTAAPTAMDFTPSGTQPNIADVVQLDGTNVIIHNRDDGAAAGASVAGKFFAIGRRN